MIFSSNVKELIEYYVWLIEAKQYGQLLHQAQCELSPHEYNEVVVALALIGVDTLDIRVELFFDDCKELLEDQPELDYEEAMTQMEDSIFDYALDDHLREEQSIAAWQLVRGTII